jgi:2-hydroxychromene-2-carboxylate isomerase
MADVTWYFDFISPFAYFGLRTLRRFPAGTAVRFEPILFAGVLNHWGQKGPAEIPAKRLWTHRSCIWLANQHGIPFRLPAAHPFNPLPYLRLSIAAGNSPTAIETIFTALWTTGVDASDPAVVTKLADALGVEQDRLADESVKNTLRAATRRAVEQGVFGIPSFQIDSHVFWGSDSIDFALAYLADPGILATDEFRRGDTLPVGATRKG